MSESLVDFLVFRTLICPIVFMTCCCGCCFAGAGLSDYAFLVSCILTVFTLLGLGVFKARISGVKASRSALEVRVVLSLAHLIELGSGDFMFWCVFFSSRFWAMALQPPVPVT
jgi:hypothetical protein